MQPVICVGFSPLFAVCRDLGLHHQTVQWCWAGRPWTVGRIKTYIRVASAAPLDVIRKDVGKYLFVVLLAVLFGATIARGQTGNVPYLGDLPKPPVSTQVSKERVVRGMRPEHVARPILPEDHELTLREKVQGAFCGLPPSVGMVEEKVVEKTAGLLLRLSEFTSFYLSQAVEFS